MKWLVPAFSVISIDLALVGCSTMKDWTSDVHSWYVARQAEWRESRQKEYAEIAAMPQAQAVIVVAGPDSFGCANVIANCAGLSCALFNEAHVLMKAYVNFVESSREYTGFANDVQFLVEEEKMSSQDACRKVISMVQAADANLPDEEKIWPKIRKGIDAAQQLDSKSFEPETGSLSSRCLDAQSSIRKVCERLNNAHENLVKARKAHVISEKIYESRMSELEKRREECAQIEVQLLLTSKCISFIVDQHNRVQELENYTR